jgi:hypothetical protein
MSMSTTLADLLYPTLHQLMVGESALVHDVLAAITLYRPADSKTQFIIDLPTSTIG